MATTVKGSEILLDDLWWSQKGLCKRDEMYREELSLYCKKLLRDDARVNKVEALLEDRTRLEIGVEALSDLRDTRSIGIIDELFAREAGRGRGFSAKVKFISSFFPQKVVGEEVVEGCQTIKEVVQGVAKNSLFVGAEKKDLAGSKMRFQGVSNFSLDTVVDEKDLAGSDRRLRGAMGGGRYVKEGSYQEGRVVGGELF
jgi:hypothetical protein